MNPSRTTRIPPLSHWMRKTICHPVNLMRIFTAFFLGGAGMGFTDIPTSASDLFYSDSAGLIRANAPKVPSALENPPWPEDLESAFWARANAAMGKFQNHRTVNTSGEQEKYAYPAVMYAYMAGFTSEAVAALQSEDVDQADHAWTLGIDYYWAFTLKGQMRKYFFYGASLDEVYRQRMEDAAAIWTAEDPRVSLELVHSLNSSDAFVRQYALSLLVSLKEAYEAEYEIDGPDLGGDYEAWLNWWQPIAEQGWQHYEDIERRFNPFPHPHWGIGTGPVGATWDPQIRGMRADARNTDNLRAMRETSVYLMAEASGNEMVRRLYKDKIMRHVRDMYHVGLGEWDSENYMHHTMGPYHNLYDFAEDPEVVALAKAALDFLYTSGALKYLNGVYGGPTKRTGGGIHRFLELAFGTSPNPLEHHYDEDTQFAATSAYRLPLAVLALARREFEPVEILGTKPTYSHWLPGAAEQPETWETLYFGESYSLGTANARISPGDVRAWHLLARDPVQGAVSMLANSGTNPSRSMRSDDQIGHAGNLALWLRPGDSRAFSFLFPAGAGREIQDGVWFVEMAETWLAIRPIGLASNAFQNYINYTGSSPYTLSASLESAPYRGFALEIGEASTHGTYAGFKQDVLDNQVLDLTSLNDGVAILTGTNGNTLRLSHSGSNQLPGVRINGVDRDWSRHDLWSPSGDSAPVQLGWREGTLRVEAGGHVFVQTVTEEGKVIPLPTSYADWAHAASDSAQEQTGPFERVEGSRVLNFVRYAMGGSPEQDPAFTEGPRLVWTEGDDPPIYTFTRPRPEYRTDVLYTVRISHDLIDWEDVEAVDLEIEQINPTTEAIHLNLAGKQPPVFVLLKVTKVEP